MTPPLHGARLLDIGCSDGLNLIAMAVAHPSMEFVGIDVDGAAVDRGKALTEELGLVNVRLVAGDIDWLASPDCPWSDQSFDFIVSHGVHSWVPERTAEALIAAMGRLLAHEGVAYLSYKTLPGAHLQEMVAEQLRLLVGDLPLREAVSEARRWLAEMAAGPSDSEEARTMRTYAAEALGKPDELLAHDELSTSRPSLVRDVIAVARAHGLDYLCDALPEPDLSWVDAAVLGQLDGREAAEREQAVDALVNRRFRRSLFVRAGRVIDRGPTPERLSGLLAGALITSESEGSSGRQLHLASGVIVRTGDSRVFEDLCALTAAWPSNLPVEGLRTPPRSLLRLYLAGALELRPTACIAARPGDRPAMSPLARARLLQGPETPTLRHTNVSIPARRDRLIASLLDGIRDRDDVAVAVADSEGCNVQAVRESLAGVIEAGTSASLFLA